jgi:RND family efflux transporter MFP subunit
MSGMQIPESNAVPVSGKRRRWPWVAAIVVLIAAAGAWWWSDYAKRQEAQAARRPSGAITVTTTKVESRDVPVKIKANGTVTALQSVDLRAQVTSTVAQVNIREGQSVAKGDLLFTLDSRADEANLKKALAQVEKDKADLSTAERNLVRQRDLFQQKFIAQAALDVAQNQVDTLNGQLAVDTAAVEAAKVALAYDQIRAPFAGRTGIINVRAGSLVQPSQSTATSPPLVTITQIDPISVAFTLPEKELAGLQQVLRAGPLTVTASTQGGSEGHKGKVTFVDNAVDSTTGTIRVKADFANPGGQLWPGMYVVVEISPRTIANATVVPAQAVQTGPDTRFVYEVGDDKKVTPRTVSLTYVEEGFAVVSGVQPGARVVVEGGQNLRPGSVVAEAARSDETKTGKEEGKKGKRSS